MFVPSIGSHRNNIRLDQRRIANGEGTFEANLLKLEQAPATKLNYNQLSFKEWNLFSECNDKTSSSTALTRALAARSFTTFSTARYTNDLLVQVFPPDVPLVPVVIVVVVLLVVLMMLLMVLMLVVLDLLVVVVLHVLVMLLLLVPVVSLFVITQWARREHKI